MARKSLSEQCAEQQQDVARLTAQNSVLGAENSSLRTALETRDAELAKLRVQVTKVEELEKRLREKETALNYTSSDRSKLESEIEQAHAVLDGVDGAPSREYDLEYGKGKRNVVTRLAGAFLAIARRGQ